jgi:hypothetical protein
MQRINEDTYIDDTLVTCAEYQLFIDEERRRGRYYQPDYWKSHQFPEGHAREPIMGVRPTDADIFCYWLAQREEVRWNYRLPGFAEAVEHPLLMSPQHPLGYWTRKNDNNGFQFLWVSKVSPFVSFDDVLVHGSELNNSPFNSEINTAPQIAQVLAAERALDLAWDIANVREHMSDLGLDPKQVNFILEELENNLNRSLKHHREFDTISTRANAMIDVIEKELDTFRNARKRRHYENRYENISQAYSLITNLAVDIILLKERIDGRSPAFEGIRLVKEWIK